MWSLFAAIFTGLGYATIKSVDSSIAKRGKEEAIKSVNDKFKRRDLFVKAASNYEMEKDVLKRLYHLDENPELKKEVELLESTLPMPRMYVRPGELGYSYVLNQRRLHVVMHNRGYLLNEEAYRGIRVGGGNIDYVRIACKKLNEGAFKERNIDGELYVIYDHSIKPHFFLGYNGLIPGRVKWEYSIT